RPGVGIGVGPDHFGVVLGGVTGELPLDPVGLVDHVVIGQNVAGAIHYHARSECGSVGLDLGAAAVSAERISATEETLEEILHPALVLIFGRSYLPATSWGRGARLLQAIRSGD